MAAAAIEVVRPPLLPPFGPDAAYHLVPLGGLLLFLRGGLLLSDPNPAAGRRPGGPLLANSDPIDSNMSE